ncbi:unnamed protein product [Malus baccata var. baccata]
MANKSFAVDLNKPPYEEWVYQPILSKGSPRCFHNDTIEVLLRSCIQRAVSVSLRAGLTAPHLALTVVVRFHRFLMHTRTTSYWVNTIHYLVHGCHHKHPMDSMRQKPPPAAVAIVCLLFWNLFQLLSPPSFAPALFGGTLLGYVTYEVTHSYMHHGDPSKGLAQTLKKYHLNHHFTTQSKGFGINLSVFWDNVFGTLLPPKAAEKNR